MIDQVYMKKKTNKKNNKIPPLPPYCMLRSFSFLISLWDFAKVCTFVDGVGGVTGGGQGEGKGR